MATSVDESSPQDGKNVSALLPAKALNDVDTRTMKGVMRILLDRSS